MPLNFKFPTSVELDFVVQEFAGTAQAVMLGHQILPLVDKTTSRVRWDVLDNDKGMVPPIASDATPPNDQRLGVTTKEYTPIEFGQFETIPRSELQDARQLGTLGAALDVTQLVTRCLARRLNKVHVRIESLIWSALTGTLSINENGVVISESFGVQTYDATTWATASTATPLKDFDAAALLFRGKGASMAGARAYANRKTINYLLENANTADFKGLISNQTTVTLGLSEVNKVLALRGLPEVVQYDEGYIDASGTFQPFVPDNKVIVVGRRAPGETIGEFYSMPTAFRMQGDQPLPGIWSKVIPPQEDSKNPTFDVGAGFRGGPVIYYPGSVIVMDVS